MTCKLNHEDIEEIPEFLCRVCTPSQTRPLPRCEGTTGSYVMPEESRKLYAKHKLRKLRREERRLSDLIDAIGPRDPARRKHLYSLILQVEREIDKLVA